MTAKNNFASPMASPVLSSTASSVASADSPVLNNQYIYRNFAEINKSEQQQQQQQQQQQEQYSDKRSFSYMNDESSVSVISLDDDIHSIASDDSRERKPERRPIADEEECDDDDEDPKIKRKAQNRAAQRAFRERKERYVKELEKKIKYVQDSHIYATTQLFQENHHLRSIIYRLELELGSLKGIPVGHLDDNKSWLSSIGPPPTMNSFHPAPAPHLSLAPLQIRPAPIASKPRKIVPNIAPEPKKQKKQHIKSNTEEIEIKQQSTDASNKKTSCSSPSVTSSSNPTATTTHTDNNSHGQQFTFSITTPDILRASSNNELIRKNEQIQAVQLYPDHSHPANCLLENKKQKQATTPVLSPQYTSSIVRSVTSFCDEDEVDKNLIPSNENQEFNDILKPFLDTRGNFDFSAFNNHNQNDISSSPSPALMLNQLLEEAAASSNNQNDWSNMMETTTTY